MEDAQNKGLTVQESVSRLLRLHWALKRLHSILVAHIASVPVYELKMAFSLHSHYCAEYVSDLADRVREMRQPPYGLEASPDQQLDQFFDEVLGSLDVPSLVVGVYGFVVPAVTRALNRIISDTNRLFDHPTYRICRLALLEFTDVEVYGHEAVRLLADKDSSSLDAWKRTLQSLLEAAGDLDGTQPKSEDVIPRIYSQSPFRYNGIPQRDERFQDPYNTGVNAEAMLFNPDIPPLPKTIMLYFKRMREIDVPEMMSSILTETHGKPWNYYRDMTRQLWDEARHAMMGEIGFTSLGIDWRMVPFNFTWSRGLNTTLSPLERHAVLFTIEQGLMPKANGKEYEWEVAVASSDRLAALIQDYDWADEIVHARIGREWLVPQFGSMQQALIVGDKAWSSILIDWNKWREDGLTEHRNWWPAVYGVACDHWGVEPDPALLAYNTTHENSRADLKKVSG